MNITYLVICRKEVPAAKVAMLKGDGIARFWPYLSRFTGLFDSRPNVSGGNKRKIYKEISDVIAYRRHRS